MAKLRDIKEITELVIEQDIKIGAVQFRKGQKVTTNPQGDGIKVTKEMIFKLIENG